MALASSSSSGGAVSTESPIGSAGSSATTATTQPPGGSIGAALSSGELLAVTCSSGSACVSVGETVGDRGLLATSSDGGGSWSQDTLPGGVPALQSVSCPDTTHCVAVGGPESLVSTDGAITWTSATAAADSSLFGVFCPADNQCLAVGQTASSTFYPSGVIVDSTDTGGTWRPAPTIPQGTGPLRAVTCASSVDCVAVGAEILQSTDGGVTWTQQFTPNGASGLTSVTCPSTTLCIATGPNPVGSVDHSAAALFYVSTDGGATWNEKDGPTGTSTIRSVSCFSVTQCTAVGPAPGGTAVSLTSTNPGSNWAADASLPGSQSLLGITCTGTTNCVSVGFSGSKPAEDTTTSAGQTWTAGVSQ
jgi:photosystem II stability/assembly factor-like uncharacterized protein